MSQVVGIDLGTTNCTMAYAIPSEEEEGEFEQSIYEIPQLTAAGEVEARPALPSFLYLPAEHEISAGNISLPWDEVIDYAVGTYARDEGVKVPDRLISSAKSWLSQEAADRRDAILPWKAPEEVARRSPVDASTAYLRHLVEAWKWKNKGDPLTEQEVILTVPASFDAVARELTAEAARAAGLTKLTLLEEPQAAFYAWLDRAGEGWRDQVKKDDLILVCDIGGGTTDLSLIKVLEEDGDLALERVKVGDHILLGGDNMDLALAVSVRARLKKEGTKLDNWQFQVLTHGCRAAKESLLSGDGEEPFQVTIPGRGSKLIGGALQVEITREETEKLLVDGFFPLVEADDIPERKRRVGLSELGLPYEAEPAITRHLAGFLDGEVPNAVLFNGGVFKANELRDRVTEQLNLWAEEEEVTVLEGTDLDLAVARGAVRYGLVRQGHGIRIRGGLSRSYYIGVEMAMPAVPGLEPPVKAVCVAPKGMEEGSQLDVPDQEFGLVVGEPVDFPFLASMDQDEEELGATHEDWEDEIEELASVSTTLDGEAGKLVPVTLQSVATEVGTLELYCVERDGEGRWKLEFEVREED